MNNEPDFVDEKIFKRHSKDAKQIEFGAEFEKRSDKDKIKYLKKLASSLNHAVMLIQDERNKLNDLLFLKESLLINCKNDRTKDQLIIQRQLRAENEIKNAQVAEIQGLYAEIKRLKDDYNN